MSLGTQIHMRGLLMLSLSLGIPYCFMLFHPLGWLLECCRKSAGCRDIDRAEMDNPSMVPSAVEHVSQPSKGNLLPQTATHASPGTGFLPSAPQEAGPFSSAFIMDMLQDFGISAQATRLICHSWRPNNTIESNTIRSCEGGEGFVLGDKYIPLLPL